MHIFRSSRLCGVTLLLAVALAGGLAGPPEVRRRARGRHRHRHGNILEQIDMDEVALAVEARKGPPPPAAPPANASLTPAQRQELIAQLRPDVLRSSRRARLITKRRYLKKDWCKTEQLVRRLREPGCRSRRVIDNFCYGQCNSFFIPREGRPHSRQAFQSCAFCQPRRWRVVRVTFLCPGRQPARRRRRVRLVKQCRCSAEKLPH